MSVKFFISCFFILVLGSSKAQLCFDEIRLPIPSDYTYVGTIIQFGGATNRGYLVDVDDWETKKFLAASCEQGGGDYEYTIEDEDVLGVEECTWGGCYSTDYIYLDVIDTKFTYEVSSCGDIVLKNESTPVSETTFSILELYNYTEVGLRTYEYIVTDLNSEIETKFSTVIGDELELPLGVYSIELKLVGVEESLNQVEVIVPANLPVVVTLKDSICEGGLYEFGGVEYDQEGEYELNLESENGCDSTVYLTLSYKTNGCTFTGLSDLSNSSVYPQPFRAVLVLEGYQGRSIQVFNAAGIKVADKFVNDVKEEIDLSEQPSGLLILLSEGKVLKVIKE